MGLIEIDIYWMDDRSDYGTGEANESHIWYEAGPPVPQVGETILRHEPAGYVHYRVMRREFCYEVEPSRRETVLVSLFADRI